MKCRTSGRRIGAVAAFAAATALVLSACGSSHADLAKSNGVTQVVIGTPNAGFSPQGINYLIADQLGYFKQQGLSVKVVNLGTVQGMQSALATGKIDFATYADTFLAQVYAQHQDLRGKGFYEFTYPFKYGIAVNPNSDIRSLGQLAGKTVGTVSFNQSDYLVGKKLASDAGADNVKWIATGIGTLSGRALQSNKVAALAYSDTGFGQILGAGIPLRFLPIPSDHPDVGGQIMVASNKIWNDHRQLASGLARAISEASVYTLANPTAAAYQYLKAYPTAAPAGESLAKQLAAIEESVVLRSKLFDSSDSQPLGTVSKTNLDGALSFSGGDPDKIDMTTSFSNAVVPYANKFDAATIKQTAQNFKVPGLDGPVPLPDFPNGTP
jgi:NitT/TauT family transport system substrate-binding protein